MYSDLDISNYSLLLYMKYLRKLSPTIGSMGYLTAGQQLQVPSWHTEGGFVSFEPFSIFSRAFGWRLCRIVVLPQIETQAYGANSITSRGSIPWNAFTDDIKACTNMAASEKKVIGWKRESCNCKLCR